MRSLATALALIATVCVANADSVFIRLSSFPSVAVADGSTPVTITATVRGSNGQVVKDGTRVKFSTNKGTFDETIVATSGGVARATLRANGVSGFATITATVLEEASTPSILEYEFVSDRSLLQSAKEYIELTAPNYMEYTVDTKIIAASGTNQGVVLRYRDVEIRADDLQYDVMNYEVRARHAHLKFGSVDQEFEELNFRLKGRQGIGTARYPTRRADFIAEWGGIVIAGIERDGKIYPPEEAMILGVVEVRSNGIRKGTAEAAQGRFVFQDLGFSPSSISAKRATIFPRREVQFRSAEILVGGTRLLKLPLFQLNYLDGNNSPIITDQLIGVNNNQVAVNYPYFLSLQPGLTSALRFRTGERYGRGLGAVNGAFLDYELDWNRGDDMQGGLNYSGIGRDDWSIGIKQYSRLGPRTTVYAQAESPANSGIYGSGNINHQFNGFSVNLSSSASRTLRGLKSTSSYSSANISSDPIKLNPFLRFSYGLSATAQSTKNSVYDRSTSDYGIRGRAYTMPLRIDRNTQIYGEFSGERFLGAQQDRTYSVGGSASVSRTLGTGMMLGTTLYYTQDGFNDALTGRYRLSHDFSFGRDRTSFSASVSRSLDIDNLNAFANLEYAASRDWRVRADYTFTRYIGLSYVDTNIGFGYRIPGTWREVGLVWSKQTQRIGFQFLSVGY
ncbi:MAG: invasin domain 3-containing protein [Fimbriimonas sp.]